MKLKSLYLIGALMFVPALAFAGQRHSASIELDQPVTVQGTQLAAGQYKLTWGDGPSVTVTFQQGRKTVATASATLVNGPTDDDAIDTLPGADNTRMLEAVDLGNLTIQFQSAAPGSGN